jgi:uncharacterized protein (DUF1800 family)
VSFFNIRHIKILSLIVLPLGLALLYTNSTGVHEYQWACSRNDRCNLILQSMHRGMVADQGEGFNPLRPGEVLELAANRLGYGTSPVDESFLPDLVTANDLPKIAWIIYSQIYGDDATLRGVGEAAFLRVRPISLELSDRVLDHPRHLCLRHDGLKFNGEFNFLNMPTATLNEQALRLRMAFTPPSDPEDRCLRRPMTRVDRLTTEINAKKELLESVFSSQYIADRRVQDLQMNFQKKIHEFWFNHFNIDTFKPGRVAMGRSSYENMITRVQNGSFRQMLGAVIKDPGMLVYLDNDQNRYENVEASNQNLGRELLELHTFGVGPRVMDGNDILRSSPYNQTDVEVAAIVLTGHNVVNFIDNNNIHQFGYRFFPARAFRAGTDNVNDNYHSKFWSSRAAADRPLFFNQTRLRALDDRAPVQRLEYLMDQLSSHASTVNNICRKFNRHFITPSLMDQFMPNCMNAFRQSANLGVGTQLQAIYFTMVTNPAFWTRTNARKMIANPLEVVVKNVRAVGLRWSDVYSSTLAESRLWDLSNFMYGAVESFGLDYRYYGPPTGYPQAGHRWLSKGYLINHVHLAKDYAQLDRMLGIATTSERRFTRDNQILTSINQIPNMSDVEVNRLMFGSVRGLATARPRLAADQVQTIRDLAAAPEGIWDRVLIGSSRVRSRADTLLTLGKTTMSEIRK